MQLKNTEYVSKNKLKNVLNELREFKFVITSGETINSVIEQNINISK